MSEFFKEVIQRFDVLYDDFVYQSQNIHIIILH